MKRNSVLTSPRIEELKRKKRKALRRKIFFYFLLFFLLFSILVYESKNSKINIQNIKVTGNKIIDTELIKNLANTEMSGRYLYIFPKTNFLLYPNRVIKNKLSNKYRRLKDISIKLKNPTTIEISLNERETKYTWCGVNLSQTIDSELKCYFLDNDGFIFDEAPYFSQDVYVRFYGISGVNIDNPIGSYYASNIFNKLIFLKEELEKINLKPKAFLIGEDGDIKMFLPKGQNQNVPEIIFKANANFNKVAENLQTALTTEPLLVDFKSKYDSLIYIDLRFDNKVYYKFK